MKKFKKKRGKKLTSSQLKRLITGFFNRNPKKRYNTKQVIEKLKLFNSRDSVDSVIKTLEKEQVLFNIKLNKYKWNKFQEEEDRSDKYADQGVSDTKEYIGTVDLTRSGSAYIVSDESELDIYVPMKFTKGAFQGDIVKVSVPFNRRRRKPEGKIIEIIKRKTTHVVGVLNKFARYGSVLPISNPRMPEVHVKLKDLEDIHDKVYVIAKITDWGINQNKAVWGKISKVLEEASENDIAMQSIILSNGFEVEFPEEVIEQVAAISDEITEEEITERRDFRNILTFTIDPATAKDFDDAISLELLDDGDIEIGVHIADVTHFMKEGTPLDKEALERSTSVYLVDRVVPMLPEKLSNELCSLNPKLDRLVFSATFRFDKDYNLESHWFGKGVIHSNKRFTYEEAQEIIDTNQGNYCEELVLTNNISKKLRKNRFKNGSINFESEEVYFELDEQAKPIAVHVKERIDTNMLIEEYMLLANKTVAQYISKKSAVEIPYVYRVHDTPDPDKLSDFALFAKELGVKMKVDSPKNIAKSFNLLGEMAAKDESLKLLEPLAIRTMAKAEYSTNNIGHYGLAFEHYAHFTSPIRRYADVLVHRILEKNLIQEYRVKKEDLERKCKHISAQERKANDAERESVKYKKVEFVLDQIGTEKEGYISGIIDKGLFVILEESRAEGLVSFSTMEEPYDVPDSRLYAIGRRSKTKIKMGDKVRIKIIDADLETRQIDMEMVDLG